MSGKAHKPRPSDTQACVLTTTPTHCCRRLGGAHSSGCEQSSVAATKLFWEAGTPHRARYDQIEEPREILQHERPWQATREDNITAGGEKGWGQKTVRLSQGGRLAQGLGCHLEHPHSVSQHLGSSSDSVPDSTAS